MFKIYKSMFMFMMMIGSMMTISANSWFGMWMGLEINLLSFIPLLNNSKNMYASEASLKYFIIQALASMVLMFSIILMSNSFMMQFSNMILMILNSAILTKMGAAPFHFWFPEIMEGLNWINCFILLTWQKIAPMMLIMLNLNLPMFFFMIIIFCMLISGMLGINQISIRKIMAYSSINHIGWMISSMFIMETIWIYYFITYFIISMNLILIFYWFNIFFIKQLILFMNMKIMLKFFFMLNFFSLGGLPPFLGFMPKWLTIQSLINENFLLLTFFMVILTLFTLFYYMRLSYSILIISSNSLNFMIYTKFNQFMIIFINFFSLMGLIFSTSMYNFL